MSGSQIGYVVGYAIGSIWGMGPIGGAIGGYIGGVIDPTQINGPHIGDGQNQTSSEGVPIPWILGTGPCVGNICDNGPRYEVKNTEGGKGSTTETNTFEAHQTFAILICESCELRDSTIVGIQMVRCNGKLVYDVRPGSTMQAESEKWKQNVTFYFGGEDQMPDPDLEAIHGVGNTPAYRGICYAVFKDFNRSEFGDAIPQFEWVVVGEGSVPDGTGDRFREGRLSGFQNSHWPLADSQDSYTYTGYWVGGRGSGASSPAFDTIAEVQEWITGFDAASSAPGVNSFGRPENYIGYVARTDYFVGSYVDSGQTFDVVDAQPDATDLESVILLYQWVNPDGYVNLAPVDMCSVAGANPGQWVGSRNGSAVRRVPELTSLDFQTIASCGDDVLEGIYPLCIQANRKRIAPAVGGASIPDLPGWYVDDEGHLFSGYSETAGTFRVLSTPSTTGTDPTLSYSKYEIGPALRSDDPDFSNSAMWTAAYDAAVLAGNLPAGWTYGVEYPSLVASAFLENDSAQPAVTTATTPLSTIVRRICRRGGLTDDDIDVSELTDEVIGYPIVGQYTAADCIRPLAGCYFFKASEYDLKIHFHKDGQDAVLVVDPQDFINGEDEQDEDKRGQEKEYPRLLTGAYIDPTLDFAVGKQKAVRRSPDVNAIGEATLQIPVVMNPDPAAQATDKAMKVTWSKLQGTRKFSLPFAVKDRNYLQMVPAIPFGLEGKRYIVDQLRINDGTIDIEASYDRQSAVTSHVTAVPTLPPTRPPSTISGPTMFGAFNLPSLRSKDNSPGMYLVACGLMSSWRGCLVQISFDLGETYHDAISITKASVMGNLTADATETSGEGSDPISVSVYQGGELVNATDAQIDAQENAFVMVDAANVAEIAQFQTQDETAPRHYDLTDVTRGGFSDPVAHESGERFAMLGKAIFLPIDIKYAGRLLYFRPVSFGTDPAANAVYPILYLPQFTGPEEFTFYVNATTGARYTKASNGASYYKVT